MLMQKYQSVNETVLLNDFVLVFYYYTFYI